MDAAGSGAADGPWHSAADVESFGMLEDGRPTRLFRLEADGVAAAVSDWGATLVSLEVPDRTGRAAGIVLGFGDVTGYETRTNNPFMGATVGRVANRIGGATFELDGVRYDLHANEGSTHLHGGRQASFDRMLWEVVTADRSHVTFRHVSPAGEAGYPGTLTATATYAVHEGALEVTYRASTDARTPVTMTQHAYFDLGGEAHGTVLDHHLTVRASAYTPVDAALVPTGEVRDVAGTPFDLREPVLLGEGVAQVAAAGLGDGYDHNLWLDGWDGTRVGRPSTLREVAVLQHGGSGRRMTLLSDQPCLQVYTGNRLGRSVGRGGITYPVHGGLCLEPQFAPDSVHQPSWPSVVLDPGDEYVHRIAYRFDVA
jgi:aldose 1-epimerase